MIDVFLFRLIGIVACFGFAALADYKTGEVPDRIAFFLVGFGIALNYVEFNLLFMAVGALIFFVGVVANKCGWIGGADVKLLSGLGFTLPLFGQGVFVLDVWLFGCVLQGLFVFSSFLVRLGLKQDVGLVQAFREKRPFVPALFVGLLFALLLRLA